MGTGEIYLDFAAIMFTVFCGAFVYLVLYLHKEGSAKVFRFVTTDRLIPTAPV